MKFALVLRELLISGGGERQGLQLCLELKRRGHDVTVYTTAFDPVRCFPEDTSRLTVVTLAPEMLKKIKSTKRLIPEGFNVHVNESALAKALAELIDHATEVLQPNDNWGTRVGYFFKERNPKAVSVLMLNDVVTARWTLFDDPLFGQPKRNPLKRPIEWFKDYLERPFFAAQDKILVLSDRTGELVRKYLGRPAETIRSGVDHERFKFVERELPFGRPIKLLSHGIFYIHRRYEDTIEALALLRKRGMNATLTIIGDNQHKATARKYFEKLEALVRKLGLEGEVSFLGRVSDEKLVASFYEADCFVTAAHMQTWGLAPFEALSSGLPVVVSTTVGASEILEDGKTAMKFEPGNPEAQAAAISKLFKNKETYERLSRDGNAFVRSRMSWARYADDMLKVFDEALRKRA